MKIELTTRELERYQLIDCVVTKETDDPAPYPTDLNQLAVTIANALGTLICDEERVRRFMRFFFQEVEENTITLHKLNNDWGK